MSEVSDEMVARALSALPWRDALYIDEDDVRTILRAGLEGFTLIPNNLREGGSVLLVDDDA